MLSTKNKISGKIGVIFSGISILLHTRELIVISRQPESFHAPWDLIVKSNGKGIVGQIKNLTTYPMLLGQYTRVNGRAGAIGWELGLLLCLEENIDHFKTQD